MLGDGRGCVCFLAGKKEEGEGLGVLLLTQVRVWAFGRIGPRV